MKLPIPIYSLQGNVYTDVEICKPRSSVIADTKKVANTGEVFNAIKVFISGCITSIECESNKIEDKAQIKNLIALMPYRSAEYLVMQIMIMYDEENDAVEGIYPCPRCGKVIKCELVKSDDYEMDTRDYISLLPVNFSEESTNTFTLELTEPIIIKNANTNDPLFTITTMELRHPTLADCMIAERQYGDTDAVRMQFAMYVQALVKYNNDEVDKKWKSMYGMFSFENIREAKKDMGFLNDEIQKYGIESNVKRICTNSDCGKEWEAPLSMSSFFVSGLAL